MTEIQVRLTSHTGHIYGRYLFELEKVPTQTEWELEILQEAGLNPEIYQVEGTNIEIFSKIIGQTDAIIQLDYTFKKRTFPNS